MPHLVEPNAQQTTQGSSGRRRSRVRYLPLALAALMATALWVFNGGQQAAPPPTTGLVASPLLDPTTTAPPSTIGVPTTVADATRPSTGFSPAVGSLDLDPPGLTAVALDGSPDQLVADQQGSLWWRAAWGVGRFDPSAEDEPTFLLAEDDLFFGSVTTISPSLESGIWVAGRDSTVRRFDGSRFVEVIGTPEPFCQTAESPTLGLWGVGCGWRDLESAWTPDTSDLLEAAGWLYRWDGEEWAPEPAGRPTVGAAELTVDLEGNVWVANREAGRLANTDGLSVFDGDQWISFTTEDGLPSTVVQRIAGAVPGEVWVATFDGPAVFDGTDWTSPSGDPDSDRRLWRGLASIVGHEAERVAMRVTGSYSMGFSAGPIRLAEGELTEVRAKRGKASNLVVAAGHVWVSIDDELLQMNDDEFEGVVATTPSTPSAADISASVTQIAALSADEALMLTHEDPWWCSAAGGCTPRPDSPPLIDSIVTSDGEVIALSSEGFKTGPWTDESDGELLRLDGDTWSSIREIPPWTFWWSHMIAPAPAGVMWLHDCIVEQMTAGELTLVAAAESFCPDMIEVDASGVMWGTLHAGDVRVLAGDRWIQVTQPPLTGQTVDLTAGADGSMWLVEISPGGATHVRSFDGDTWRDHGRRLGQTFHRDFGYSVHWWGWPSGPQLLASLPKGRMALATSDGFYLYVSQRWTPILSGWFGNVSASPDGSLWVAGASGIYVWPGEDLQEHRWRPLRTRLRDSG